MVSKNYNYTPLSSPRLIRLIRILPPQRPCIPRTHGTVRIEILETDIDTPIPHDALSYVWAIPPGITEPNRSVIIETDQGPKRIKVYRPLELALLHLEAMSCRPLFVDQLCINQKDSEEKSQQVQLMRDIYSRSIRTVIWLGPTNRASSEYLNYVEDVVSHGVLSRAIGPHLAQFMNVFDAVMDPTLSVTDLEREDRDDILALISRYGDSFPIDGIIDILQRPWFNRLWTIQEACLAPNVVYVCGDKQLCYDCFRMGVLFFNIYNTHWVGHLEASVAQSELKRRNRVLDMTAGFRRIISERRAIHQSNTRQNLYDIIIKYNVNENSEKIGASLAVDRLFALMGLTAEADELRQQVRVRYDVGIAAVYTEVAARMMEQNIDLLLFSQFPKQVTDGLPSWAPDWSMNLAVPFGFSDLAEPAFSAGITGGESNHVEFDENSGQITLQGVYIDQITRLGECSLQLDPDKTVFKQLDYRSARRIFSEATQFIHFPSAPLLEEQQSIAETPPSDQLLRLCDGGLTMKQLTSTLGAEAGAAKARFHHQHVSKLGASLIRSDNFLRSYHITRIYSTIGILPWYCTPAPEMDFMAICAGSPVSAGKILIDGLRDFVTDIFGICYWATWVKLLDWRIKLRNRYGRMDIRPSQERFDQVQTQSGIDIGNIEEEGRDVLLNNLIKNVGRRLYRTKEGYLGMGPQEMSEGDVVVVMLGGSVPHVLRKSPPVESGGRVEEGDVWSYVGEAYCDGMMEGEALKMESLERRAFTLC